MTFKILVPLDGTEVGKAALPRLEELVLKTAPIPDVEVTLLKVITRVNFNVLTGDDEAQLPLGVEELKELEGEAAVYLEGVAAGLKAQGMMVKVMVAVGHAAEEIVKAADAIDANLIAMATHGRKGFARWTMGSVTEKVIQLEGRVPVLAVNTTTQAASPVFPRTSLQRLVKQAFASQ